MAKEEDLSSLITPPSSDNTITLTYLSLSSIIVLVSSYEFLISIESLTERIITLSILSSILTSLMILIKLDDLLLKIIYVRRNNNGLKIVKIAKQAPLKGFYSTIVTQLLLIITFIIIAISSFFSPFDEIPQGLFFNLFSNIPLKGSLLILFLIIIILLLYRTRNLNKEYSPRMARANVYYNLLKDVDTNSSRSPIIKFINNYGTALSNNDWSEEESQYNRLERECLNQFLNIVSDFSQFIKYFAKLDTISDNYMFELIKDNRFLRGDTIKKAISDLNVIGLSYILIYGKNIKDKLEKLLKILIDTENDFNIEMKRALDVHKGNKDDTVRHMKANHVIKFSVGINDFLKDIMQDMIDITNYFEDIREKFLDNQKQVMKNAIDSLERLNQFDSNSN